MIRNLIILWTIVAIVLNLCGVGDFATWKITALPWHWSCCCIFYWWLALFIVTYIVCIWKAAKRQAEYDALPDAWKAIMRRHYKG